MKKIFKTDASKLNNVEMVHDFYPLKDSDVYVEVEHLRNGELVYLMDANTKEFDFPKMFLKKVKSVHNLQIEDSEGKTIDVTKEHIVNIPDADFLAIVMSTCSHLLNSMNHTEDEVKN